MQILRYFDPAREGFTARLLKAGAVALALALCALLAVASVAWRSERLRFVIAFVSSELSLHPVSLYVCRGLTRDHPTSDWDYYRLEAKALRHLGRADESLEAYDRAVRHLPDEWWAHSHRCFYGALLGDARTVLDACDRQLALDPDQLDVAYDRRAIARAMAGDTRGAIADLERALPLMRALQPDDWRVPVRQQWLADLRSGRDPFTPEAIARELEQY